jgi:RNA polymerase sigma-70 factor (ECF subfamily)
MRVRASRSASEAAKPLLSHPRESTERNEQWDTQQGEQRTEALHREGVTLVGRFPAPTPSFDDGPGYNAAKAIQRKASDQMDHALQLLGKPACSLDREKDIVRQTIVVDLENQITALYDEYRPRLFGYLRSLGLDEDRTDETIQETFMRLTRELLKKDGMENVQGWIVRVAHNLAMDSHARRERNESAHGDSAFVLRSCADPGLNPEETYLRNERIKCMEDALKNFSEKNRQCLYMRMEGFRYKDIALALGISEPRAIFVVKQVAMRLAAVCG